MEALAHIQTPEFALAFAISFIAAALHSTGLFGVALLSEPLLHGEQFPTIRVESAAIEGSLPDATIVVNVVVKGTEQTVSFPASIELTDDRFMVRGQRDIMHGEFGLSPFTAMGGALSVRDLLVFKYEISGERIAD